MAKHIEGKKPEIETPVEVATQDTGAASAHLSDGENLGDAESLAPDAGAAEVTEVAPEPSPVEFFPWSSEGINHWNRVKDECFAEGSEWERKVISGHGFLVRALPDGRNVHRPDSYIGHDIVGDV